MLDESEFGRRAARRLKEERLAWLTTVSPKGTPQPVPVWFLWDGDASILLYSRPDKPKLRNITENPRVSLHLDGDGMGGTSSCALAPRTSRTIRRRTRCLRTSRSTTT
jgi:PPOX class probable F420-dependent enzyme